MKLKIKGKIDRKKRSALHPEPGGLKWRTVEVVGLPLSCVLPAIFFVLKGKKHDSNEAISDRFFSTLFSLYFDPMT